MLFFRGVDSNGYMVYPYCLHLFIFETELDDPVIRLIQTNDLSQPFPNPLSEPLRPHTFHLA